jgi:hypothetical protein
VTTPERQTEHDDLLSPSLTGSKRRQLPAGERPWRLGSQFYVAFFGGPLAAGAIGYVNAKRLGLPGPRLTAIAAIGVACFIGAVTAAVVLADAEAGQRPRFMLAVAGAVAYVGARQLQRDADHLYGLNRDDEQAYDSLWGPGLGAIFLFGIFSLVVVAAVA